MPLLSEFLEKTEERGTRDGEEETTGGNSAVACFYFYDCI